MKRIPLNPTVSFNRCHSPHLSLYRFIKLITGDYISVRGITWSASWNSGFRLYRATVVRAVFLADDVTKASTDKQNHFPHRNC